MLYSAILYIGLKGTDSMKRLKKYLSVLMAVLMLGAYTALPAYAEEDPEEIIPIEEEDDEEDSEPDADDPDSSPGEIEFVGETTGPDDETDDTPAETTQGLPDEDLITPEDTTGGTNNEIPPYTATGESTMYATEVVNVRYGPDTSYSKAGTVYANSPVTVVGYSGGWYAIKYNNSIGFVSSGFFSDKAPETTTTTAAQTTPQEAAETQPQDAHIDDFPPETEPPVTEYIEPVETTTAAEEISNIVTTSEETEPTGAGTSDNDNNNKPSGLMSILIALGCAVGTFIIIGVVPVMIHRIHHNKLYQY